MGKSSKNETKKIIIYYKIYILLPITQKVFKLLAIIYITVISLQIRYAKEEDKSGFIKLALERKKAINAKQGRIFWINLFNQLSKNKKLLIARNKTEVTGFLYYDYFLSTKYPYIELIWVSFEHRKEGIARALFEKMEKITLKQKQHKLISSTDFDNYVSLKMHKTLGFKECGYIKNLGKLGEKEIFLYKELN